MASLYFLERWMQHRADALMHGHVTWITSRTANYLADQMGPTDAVGQLSVDITLAGTPVLAQHILLDDLDDG